MIAAAAPRPVAAAPVRVLAADRQPLYREALARAVRKQAGFRLIADVADGRAALAAIERHVPEVAVVDVALPQLDGRRVLNAVVRDDLPTRVVLLSPVRQCAGAYEALAAGAAGWLSKSAGEAELCAAIAAAARGEVALDAHAQTAVAAEIRRRASGAEPQLSELERRLLTRLAAGHSTTHIAFELGLRATVVKSTLLALYRRLGVSERTAAVAVALRRGLID